MECKIYRPDLLINLLGTDKAAVIGHHYMNSEQSQIQESSLKLLALICQRNENEENEGPYSIWKCLNILPQLTDIFMTSNSDKSVQLALDCIIMLCQSVNVAKYTLIHEAKRSKPFYQTALQIPQLKAFFD